MNLIIKKIVAGLIMAFSMMPILAFAEDVATTTTAAPAVSIPPAGGFCAHFTEISTKLSASLASTEAKKKENELKQESAIATKEATADAKRAEGRTEADNKRAKNFDKLNMRTKTDTQKTAVEAYKQTIAGAVTTRQTAVDAAVKTYRDGITALLGTNNVNIDTSIATFKSSVDAASQKATLDCANKVANKTVSATFNKSVKDARAILASSKKSSTKNTALKALKATRDQAFRKAESDFKTTADKARADLLVALK